MFEAVLAGGLFFIYLCYFLLLHQKKVTKEKVTGKDNLSLFVRLQHRPLHATKQAKVRAFWLRRARLRLGSGLPTHVYHEYFIPKGR